MKIHFSANKIRAAAKHSSILIFLFTLVFFLCPGSAFSRVYLDITSADLKKLPIAVPSFINKEKPDEYSENGKNMADLMSRALNLHGFISIIPTTSYNDDRSTDWEKIGADFVLLGSYASDASGLVLEMRFLDTHEKKMIYGKRYRAPLDARSKMIFKFCDEVIYKITGEQGISNTQIAYVSDATGNKEVYITDVLEENIRQVTRHRHMALYPRFSPDGGMLAYSSNHHYPNQYLYITDLSQNKSTKAISTRTGLNYAPAWSPDGKTLVTTLSKDGNPDLYTMTPKGKLLKRLTKNEGINVSASWAPDGKRFAFVSDRSGKPQLYIMDFSSQRTTRLTYDGLENTTPSWSPKGDLIAYTGRVEGNHHLFVISAEGGTPTRLTKYWGNHESPSWAPDGRQLIFTRTRSEQKQLCRLFLNGGGITPILLNQKGNHESPQWSPRLQY